MALQRAFIKQVEGITFAANADSNHWVIMDGPEEFGGTNAGVRPKELLLFALGGCTSTDVIAILRKKRAPLQGYELEISADVRDEHPRIFTQIHLEYIFYGDGLNPADVARAIELSVTKYCPVTAMLRTSVPITHSYVIRPVQEAAGRPAVTVQP